MLEAVEVFVRLFEKDLIYKGLGSLTGAPDAGLHCLTSRSSA